MKAAHEIDRVVCGDDAQVSRARPERKNRRHRGALLEIIVVRQHAASWDGLPCRRNRRCRPCLLACAGEIRARVAPRNSSQRTPPARSAFGGASVTTTVRSLCSRNAGACVIARHSGYSTNNISRFRVRQQLKMFGGGKFVIERNKNAARKKYRVRRNQPLGLIGHDDRGAVPGGKARFFECGSQGSAASPNCR